MEKLKKLIIHYAFMMLIVVAASCRDNKSSVGSENDSQNVNLVVLDNEESSGVDLLKDLANTYNTYYAQTLTTQNPVPNVYQSVDEDNKLFVFDYIWNEAGGVNVENHNHEAGMRGVFNEMTQNPQSINFMRLLVDEGYGIRFRMTGSESHRVVVNDVSSEYIDSLLNKALSF